LAALRRAGTNFGWVGEAGRPAWLFSSKRAA
jgi:hypothetical protein